MDIEPLLPSTISSAPSSTLSSATPFPAAAPSSLRELSQYQLLHLLQFLPGFGPVAFWRVHNALADIRNLVELPASALAGVLTPQPAAAFLQLRQRPADSPVWAAWQNTLAQLDRLAIQLVTHLDDAYPPLLSEIAAPPPLLYVRGRLAALQQPQVAIVGSRHATRSGLANAHAFSRDLAANGFAITSGLALGIDGAAHQGALDGGGTTLAIMGCGLDQIYPRQHQNLAAAILEHGGVQVSEFAPGVQPQPGHFPRRNRIISGLSLGILVVEAAIKSGSLSSARFGLDHNREVFAIPGSIHNPLSRGCHALIRQGATLVETSADILQQLQGWLPAVDINVAASSPPAAVLDLTEQERKLWQLIGFEAISLDLLVSYSSLNTGDVLAALMGLELKGLIEPFADGYQRQR